MVYNSKLPEIKWLIDFTVTFVDKFNYNSSSPVQKMGE